MENEAHFIDPVQEGRHSGEDCWLFILVALASRTVTDDAMDSPGPINETVEGASRVTLEF